MYDTTQFAGRDVTHSSKAKALAKIEVTKIAFLRMKVLESAKEHWLAPIGTSATSNRWLGVVWVWVWVEGQVDELVDHVGDLGLQQSAQLVEQKSIEGNSLSQPL